MSNCDRSGTHKTTVYVSEDILNEVGDGRARLAKKAGASVPTGIIRPPSLVGGRTVSVKLTPQERQPEKDKSMSREARKIKVINV